jgi:AraC family transcriptional activator of tynA and feaB
MLQRGLLSTPQLDYDQWRDMLRPNWGLYTVDDPKSFAGRVRSRSICGFNAADISNNIRHCERTQRDVRLDGVDHCYAVFQMAGRSTIVQNDCAVTLAVGDVALIDSARAVTYVNEGNEQWLSLQLPRPALVAHLGFEPQGGVGGCRGTAGRLHHQLVREAAQDEASTRAPAGSYMKLAVYDLLGALFVPPDLTLVSGAAAKLFKRVCDIVRDRFADPAFGPWAGIGNLAERLPRAKHLPAMNEAGGVVEANRLDEAAAGGVVRREELLQVTQRDPGLGRRFPGTEGRIGKAIPNDVTDALEQLGCSARDQRQIRRHEQRAQQIVDGELHVGAGWRAR